MQIGYFATSLITDSYLSAFRAAKKALEVAKEQFEKDPSSYHLDTLSECQANYDYEAKMFADLIENDISQHGF